MALLISFFASFAAAALAPLLIRASRTKSLWVLSAVPAGLALGFASLTPAVVRGEFPSLSVPWVPELGISFALRLDGLSLLMALGRLEVFAILVLVLPGFWRE